jgi:hypothetical protein
MSHRDYALVILAEIERTLQRGENLSITATQYLIEVCKLAREDDPDPLGITRKQGRQADQSRQLAMAQAVDSLVQGGATFSNACDTVGEMFGGVTGSDGGAVAKAWGAYKDDVIASRLLFEARSANRPFTPEESTEHKECLGRALAANAERNRRKTKKSYRRK